MSSIVSMLARRFRTRAVVELENLALRHQLHVLRRQRPGRLQLITFDRLLWVWLYRLWPRCLDTMVLVKPSTVVQWHRQGFRLFWRWRSRSGRRPVDREIRKLIREMSGANPLWGAPGIHGELLKLGIEISQATIAKYMVRRRGVPSPSWGSFLRNQAAGITAIDMFVAHGREHNPSRRPANANVRPLRTLITVDGRPYHCEVAKRLWRKGVLHIARVRPPKLGDTVRSRESDRW
jgi:hypothetical protein